MAIWTIASRPRVNPDPTDADAAQEILCFRIFPVGKPELWIAETNPDLPLAVQEEFAALMAEALSNLLGV